MIRRYSLVDRFCIQANQALTTVFTVTSHPRAYASDVVPEQPLTEEARKVSVGCMRVNHVGEVCAQALYRGQLITSREVKTKEMLERSCAEETDHLAWTKTRIEELGGKTSYFSLIFYCNSFLIGLIAGACGDRWSLGFVEETEIQVAEHLTGHLEKISPQDERSRVIIEKMREEEMMHEKAAATAGAASLPWVIKKIMKFQAKVMTTLTYKL